MLIIHKGDKFATPFERGCIALADPDKFGNFDGLDSDGIRANFHEAMVCDITEVEPRPCAECGHLHFVGKAGYIECPVEGCDCPGQP